ncbi:PLDc_N domain-containing protein [Methanococcoides orientis]|nr:PLDc_N domain-containing protein [Methanococcoides orientis]
MLIDCLQRPLEDFPQGERYDKLIWSLAIIFLNFIGAVLYYYLVRNQDNNENYISKK